MIRSISLEFQIKMRGFEKTGPLSIFIKNALFSHENKAFLSITSI